MYNVTITLEIDHPEETAKKIAEHIREGLEHEGVFDMEGTPWNIRRARIQGIEITE